MKREKTAEEKQRAAEKRQKLREIARKISKMSQDEREKLVDNWPTTIEGRQLSLHNACMLVIQYPGVTVVGGFNQWRKAGRYVSSGKGSGLGIWVPIGGSKSETDEGETIHEGSSCRFMVGTVFDISQTSEMPKDDASGETLYMPKQGETMVVVGGERADAFALAESEAA